MCLGYTSYCMHNSNLITTPDFSVIRSELFKAVASLEQMSEKQAPITINKYINQGEFVWLICLDMEAQL